MQGSMRASDADRCASLDSFFWRWIMVQSMEVVSLKGAAPATPKAASNGNGSVGSRPPASADLFPGVGFRIQRDFPRIEVNVAKLFEKFALADISDHLNRLYTADCAIRCLSGEDRRLVGPACTVKIYPGDNLMVHKALDIAKPGDVIVVDARGSNANAVLGDTISMKARHRQI